MEQQKQAKGVSPAATAVIAAVTLVIGIYIGTVISGMSAPPPPQRAAAPGMPPAAPPAMTGQSQQGEIPEAMAREIASMEVRTSSNPDDKASWTQLGHLYFDTNQPEKAIRAYTHALDLDPSNADVWTDLGVMYRRAGQPGKAVESFDKAIENDPAHQTARFNKGVVLMHDLGDQAGAIAAWKGLLAINPQATAPNGVPVAGMIQELEKMQP